MHKFLHMDISPYLKSFGMLWIEFFKELGMCFLASMGMILGLALLMFLGVGGIALCEQIGWWGVPLQICMWFVLWYGFKDLD